MMLSIFQSISIPRTWLRWVKWREWWQTKVKRYLMKGARQTAKLACTLIVLLYCHFTNDQSLRFTVVKSSSLVTHWLTVVDMCPTVSMSVSLWYFKWLHHIIPCMSVCGRIQLIFFFFFCLKLLIASGGHQCSVTACFFQTMRPFSMCIQ